MHSGSSLTPNNPAFSISIGIAALIIEGRPLFDDEYAADAIDEFHQPRHSTYANENQTVASAVYGLMPMVLPDTHSTSQENSFTSSSSSSSLSSSSSNVATPHANRSLRSLTSSNDLSNALPATSAFVSKPDSVQHLERLRQKLHQLRSSPSTSRDFAEQTISVSADSPPPPPQTSANEPDLDHDEELEIIYKQQPEKLSRRLFPHPTSDSQKYKTLHQTARNEFYNPATHQSSGATSTVTSDCKTIKPIKPIALNSFHMLTTTSLQRTPRSLNEHNGLLKTVESWTSNKFTPDRYSTPSTSSSSDTLPSPSIPLLSNASTPLTINCQVNKLKLKEKRNAQVLGAHCEQFLSKIGLLKSSSGGGSNSSDHSVEFDEHECLRSSDTCFRWQQCYKQIVPVFARGEPICIEVYLGPEHHVILLEQWVIRQSQEAARFSMTIQSLCTAIRSQLHFSQITAWSDLLKSASPFDNDFKSNPRIKNASKVSYKPKLDILYRIRPYSDAMASCFSAIPIEHNFPETMVSEQLSIKVSLKSLPRIKNIPQLYDSTEISDLTNETSTIQPIIVDDRHDFGCNEKGKHRCPFDEESPTDDALSHRDKQLLKYKKRMMRRDKKKRTDESSTSIAVTSKIESNESCSKNLALKQYDQTINPNKPPLYSTMSIDTEPSPVSTTISTNTLNAAVRELRPIGLINDAMMITKSTQTAAIETTSVATQTDSGQIIFHNCDFCGIEMQYFCWNCDKRMFTESKESQQQLDKADLLLRAIQRTPSTKQQQALNTKKSRTRTANQSHTMPDETNANNNNNNNTHNNNNNNNNNSKSNNNNNNVDNQCMDFGTTLAVASTSSSTSNRDTTNDSKTHDVADGGAAKCASDRDYCDNNSSINKNELDISDCRSCCKRQKTVHNYYRDSISISNDDCNNTICGPNLPIRKNSKDDFALKPNVTSYDDADTHLVAKREHVECTGSYRRTMSESVVGTCHTATENCTQPGIDLAICESMNILSDNELKLYRRAYSEDELICNCDDNRPKQLDLNATKSPPNSSELPLSSTSLDIDNDTTVDCFKTPTTKQSSQAPFDYQTKPIFIDCHTHGDEDCSQDSISSKLPPSKSLPKINLSKLFVKTPEPNQIEMDESENDADEQRREPGQLDVEAEIRKISQTAISQQSKAFPQIYPPEMITLNNIFDFDNLSPPLASPTTTNGNATVQKSNSAPSFQHSPPILSPRFLKSAAASKRRSRHLSDRSSERLSVGSDDHLSDEEFHQYCLDPDSEYRPGISPTKATLRFFPKNYAYRKRALLGSFEESLLQRRFEPKFLVPGYKVLLGASGCYCTNQITIPAYTFFYEMNAVTLSTPYVCEVSMPPRKGYVIPRTGHVQATLLNPNGMVVRMFVVAYDFRDMPAMCQTFVRQRILSFDENANPGQSVDDLSASEQMKLLRYAIHLRFQTTRSGRLALHGDIRMLISRRTDCDTAAAHAKGALESPSELKTVTIVPENPKFSPR